jgi:hypothetical protein
VIPKPLAWGIASVLTLLEALNVVAAIWVDGYESDWLVHFTFTSVVGFMLGMREGSTAVARAMTAFRNVSTPPPAIPPNEPPQPPADLQEPKP